MIQNMKPPTAPAIGSGASEIDMPMTAITAIIRKIAGTQKFKNFLITFSFVLKNLKHANII